MRVLVPRLPTRTEAREPTLSPSDDGPEDLHDAQLVPDAYLQYVARKRGAEASISTPVSGPTPTQKAIPWSWLLGSLAITVMIAIGFGLVWTYAHNYSLYCAEATQITGTEFCSSATDDGWTRDPTPREWAEIDDALWADRRAGNVALAVVAGVLLWGVACAGVLLRRNGKSLWWLALVVLGPLAIVAAVIALLALLGASSSSRTSSRPAAAPPLGHHPPRREPELWIVVYGGQRYGTMGPWPRHICEQWAKQINEDDRFDWRGVHATVQKA